MSDKQEIKYSSGIKHLASVPDGERIVSMVLHKGVIVVATCTSLYTLNNNKLVPVDIEDT